MGHLHLPGINGNIPSIADAAYLETADLDVAVWSAQPDWSPAIQGYLAAKYAGGGGQRSWRWAIRTTGGLRLRYSENGIASVTKDSSVVTGFADGAIPQWLRFTLDSDDGAGGSDVTFYTGGVETTPIWVQLGAVVHTASTVSLFDSSDALKMGEVDGVGNEMDLYKVQLRSTIGGALSVDADFTDLTQAEIDAGSFIEDSSNAAVVTLNGSAWSYVFVDPKRVISSPRYGITRVARR